MTPTKDKWTGRELGVLYSPNHLCIGFDCGCCKTFLSEDYVEKNYVRKKDIIKFCKEQCGINLKLHCGCEEHILALSKQEKKK